MRPSSRMLQSIGMRVVGIGTGCFTFTMFQSIRMQVVVKCSLFPNGGFSQFPFKTHNLPKAPQHSERFKGFSEQSEQVSEYSSDFGIF